MKTRHRFATRPVDAPPPDSPKWLAYADAALEAVMPPPRCHRCFPLRHWADWDPDPYGFNGPNLKVER